MQKSLNEAAGIGLNPVRPELNEDRLSSLIDALTEDGKPFDEVRKLLEAPVVNFCQNVVDESVEKNAEMHYASGMMPKIKRIITGHKACKFCIEIAGEHKYPLTDNRIYQRHENCRCLVLYDPGNGKYQDAHTRQSSDSATASTIRINLPAPRPILRKRKSKSVFSKYTMRC